MSQTDRKTNVDIVFEYLYNEIVTLSLTPETKISEAEIASKFGVSRQPVRDAFYRLQNHNLLLIRPQKATEVKKFSLKRITKARFIRLSIELEVLRRIAETDGINFGPLRKNLENQEKILKTVDADRFNKLDYEFHSLLCKAGNAEFTAETIAENKAVVERLCRLELMNEAHMAELFAGHVHIVDFLEKKDLKGAQNSLRTHLSRIDQTIESVRKKHPGYFEEESPPTF